MNPPQPATPDLQPIAFVPPGRPMVAVMPFQAAVDDEPLRLLGAEIADALRERLESDPKLQPIVIRSDFLAEAPAHALELVCRQLRVGYLISGKCHPGGGTPSLYIEVSDTRAWHIQWAQFHRATARSLLVPGSEAMDQLVASLRGLLVNHPAR